MPTPSARPSEFRRPEDPGDLTPYLVHLLDGNALDEAQAAAAFEAIMTGTAHHAEIGGLLSLLAARGPSVDEIVGAARVMRRFVDPVRSTIPVEEIVDTAGTGGAPKTFNVSTAAAVIAAAGGARVAKHGNRSRTGRGSAEVLQAVGVNVEADRATQAACLEEAGVCFCFAIHHHPAAKHAMPVRKALGFPTIFNLLGPLTNPAGARRQVMGVYDRAFVRPIAESLGRMDSLRAMVVHSDDGLDEISIDAPTLIAHVDPSGVREERLDPRALGLQSADRDDVTAKDLDHAAALLLGVLRGDERGPARDMALVNAAAALVAAGVSSSVEEGITVAAHAVDFGEAIATLDRLAERSRSS